MTDHNRDGRKNPFRAFFDFNRDELPVVGLMFLFFFLIISVFQLVRPLKKGIFVDTFGADLELYAKLANIAVSAVGVVVFTYLVNKLPRQRVIYGLSAFFAGSFLALRFLLASDPAAWSIWSFYLVGDLLTTMMVAAFWAYLTDISSSDQAKRLYGLIGAGGVIGGWVGVTIAKLLLKQVGMTGLLMLAAALTASIIIITFALERYIRRSRSFASNSTAAARPDAKKNNIGVAAEGARLALTSGYLAAIMGIMFLYEIGSQTNDYQFSKFSEGLEGVANTQAFFTNVSFYANLLGVVVQLFLVSFIMKRFGVLTALLVLPLAMILSSTTFMMIPTLAVASLLFISDNGLNYSVQQTARESLYVVTSPDEKYKARAFTNMFVQRFAKGVGIFVVLGLGALGLTGTSVRYLSFVTITVMALTVVLSIYAGRRFNEKSRSEEASVGMQPAYQPAR